MRRALPFLTVLLLATGLAPAAESPDKHRTEADLKAIASQIERVQEQVRRDAVERDRLSRDLRESEESVSSARGALAKLRAERVERPPGPTWKPTGAPARRPSRGPRTASPPRSAPPMSSAAANR